ncbi:MAG TPA: hypothetical protein VFU31_29875 [Candidatus Binatia bacterium]|nr:hypothetical protein [Candidatus Binatia bacterium]
MSAATDDEIKQIALEFRRGLLGDEGSPLGMCYAVSAPLTGLLSFYGVPCELIQTDHSENLDSEWHAHYWIRLEDGRALDPTFDQFRAGEPVYLGEPTEFH